MWFVITSCCEQDEISHTETYLKLTNQSHYQDDFGDGWHKYIMDLFADFDPDFNIILLVLKVDCILKTWTVN